MSCKRGAKKYLVANLINHLKMATNIYYHVNYNENSGNKSVIIVLFKSSIVFHRGMLFIVLNNWRHFTY